jgi:hypothetical protein
MTTTVTGALSTSYPATPPAITPPIEEPVTAEIVEESVSSNRVMYDSNTVNAIPLEPAPQMVCWYPFTWAVTNKADNTITRFGSETQILSIDNVGNEPGCDILDVETGAATFADAATWVKEKRKLGGRVPTVYVSADNIPGLVAALKAGIAEDFGFVWVWVAEWTGEAHEYAGDVQGLNLCATQYASPSTPAFNGQPNYDLSLVSNADWHPVPSDPPAVSTPGVVAYVSGGKLATAEVGTLDGKTWTVT